jgi:photosynthetic reaction center cytochrome c subunit
MKLDRRIPIGATITLFMCLPGVESSSGQTALQRPQMAEEVFKNVPVLKGIPVDEFMDTMGMFSAATNMNCTDCHTEESGSSWERYADDTDLKRTARRMVLMVNTINRNNFGGARAVTCFTCHRGSQRPEVVPNLAIQYGIPSDDPNSIEIFPDPQAPSVDQVFDKYIQAIGGAQRVEGLTSFVAKGTYEGYDTEMMKVPVEIFAKAPDQRSTIVHASWGDSIRVYDGRAGWIASPDKPVPLMPLSTGNLEGARIESIVSFPAQLKESFSQWKVGSTIIGDRDVQVVQGTGGGQSPVNLYFDESGMLVRLVRWSDTVVGRVPTQIDFANYRDVSGVKIPFRWTVTWTNGQTTTELSEVQPNAAIDPSRFARPAPAPPPKLQ